MKVLPAIHLWPYVGTALDNLGGCVQGAAAEGAQEILAVVDVGQAEVGDLQETLNIMQKLNYLGFDYI